MLCNSTGNQIINLIPAKQFECKEVVIISTAYTQGKGFTDRLIEVFKKYNISSKVEHIKDTEEKNLRALTDILDKIAWKYPKILWNISGGQKIPSAAMLIAFQQRIARGFTEDYVTYTEANPPYIWYFGSDYKSKKEKTSVSISLSDILYLSGYETMGNNDKLYPDPSEEIKDCIDIGRKAFTYFRDNKFFREAFFNYMKPSKPYVRTRTDIEDLLKDALNAVKPKLLDIKTTQMGYEDLETKINDIFSNLDKARNKKELIQLIKPLKIISKPSVIYEDYWNSI
ncbi:MAG: hypothetical protein ACP5JP_08290, partial [bacterium]